MVAGSPLPPRLFREEENILIPRRSLATAFTTLLLASAFVPLATSSTEPTPNGDVIVNGGFADARPVGHPAKFYCASAAGAGENPTGCLANQFFAYDWTVPAAMAENVTLVEGGVQLVGNTFIQQHFNGSEAPDREMELFRVAITGRAATTSSASLRVEIRADGNGDGTVDSYTKRITLLSSTTTTTLTASDLMGPLSSGAHPMRSLRLWLEGGDAVLSRVSVFATNGADARNILILPAGDDVVSELDGVALLNAGDDGRYSFLVGMASDNGAYLPTQDAWLCAFTAEQTIEQQPWPANTPDQMCPDSLFDPEDARIVKTYEGGAWRVDVPAGLVRFSAEHPSQIGAVSFYGHVKVDGSYRVPAQTSAQFQSGYFSLPAVAAAAAGAGASFEKIIPTPVFIDNDANGVPDQTQTQEMDGYSVIITPLLSTTTPVATVVTTDVNAEFLFDVQVYEYDADGGSAMDIPRGISFGLFDLGSAVANSSPDAPFWRTDDFGHNLERIDAKTWRVHVPASYVEGHPVAGAWAFYNVGNGQVQNVFGRSTSSTDFYSSIRNAVKHTPAADGMRAAMTPLVFDAESITRDATVVVKTDPEADTLTALDGTLVVDDQGDGSVTFEYALLFPDTVRVPGGSSHAIALYDAAGLASDRFQPGPAGMEHALWVGQGVAQPDGWFRADIPTDAFLSAKGATGVWAYVNDEHPTGYVLSRSGWYNALKPAVASVSTSAANASLYAPTPIVLVDAGLGIPVGLASAMAGIGTDLFNPTNPFVNPGFETDVLVEGANDRADNTGAAMTSPPWFFRLDDKGTGQPTNPKSTHTVAYGKGKLGDNALRVDFSGADRGKSLMLGQLLGSDPAGDAYVWQGAKSVAFDVHAIGAADITFTAVLRWADENGVVTASSGRTTYMQDSEWHRLGVNIPNVPEDGRLLGFYLVMDATASTSFYLDNLVLVGAKTALGDTRSDISDGYAVVIAPEGMTGARQDLVQTADGAYYVYNVTVMDYTQGTPRALDLAGLPQAFALRTDELQKGGGEVVQLRGRTDAFAAVVPAGAQPAQAAVPWAWVGVGESFPTLDGLATTQPASGHYNPMKNSLAFLPFADQLDYAATPVVFGSEIAKTVAAQQTLRLIPVGGAHALEVKSLTPYVETTTVTVTGPGGRHDVYSVTLDSDDGNVVDGLSLTTEDLQTVTITTSATRFARGATLVAGEPLAQFEVCRPAEDETCLLDGATTGEALAFRSTSISPTGEPLTYVWTFGDGATATGKNVAHAYGTPGMKTATLVVQTPSGKRSTAQETFEVFNRAPVVNGLDITPTDVYVDSTVRARVRAVDPDGGQRAYAWTINGQPVEGANRDTIFLTPDVLDATTGVAGLVKDVYTVGVTVTDGQGGSASTTKEFTVQDRASSISTPAIEVVGFGGDYALPGDELAVSVRFSDVDDVAERVSLAYATPEGSDAVDLVSDGEGNWTGTFPAGLEAGDVSAVATAYDADDVELATSGEALFEVRENAAPELLILGPTSLDVGENATYNVTAVDPDGRGLGDVELAGADGVVITALGDGAFEVVFGDVGVTTLTASVEDVDGAVGTSTLDVAVDDVIVLALEIVSEPTSATQGYLVRIRVSDANGDGIAGASIVLEDRYSIVPVPVDTQEAQTDPDGSVTLRLAPQAGGLVDLGLTRTITVTATAGSLEGAPDQGDETAEASLTVQNGAGPLAGLPLP